MLYENHPENLLAEGVYVGFKWAVFQTDLAHRCGYVRIPLGHPWHGLHYDAIDANCHGGLTFSDKDDGDDSWWVGFDCGHSGDAPDPTLRGYDEQIHVYRRGEVRTQEYVEAECRSLCEQARNTTGPWALNILIHETQYRG